MKKNILPFLFVVTILCGGVSISWIQEHGWRRPYVNWGIGELAEHLVKNNLSPRGCFDLVWHGIGQQEGEAQAECVYKYAKLAKDPSACELLMPSSYGLDCVGGASEFVPCSFDDDKKVVWNDGEYKSVPYERCATETSVLGKACCSAARSKFDPSFVVGCEKFKPYNPLLADQCSSEVALKKLQPELCANIENGNLRSACTVRVTVLKQHLELRDAYPFLKP